MRVVLLLATVVGLSIIAMLALVVMDVAVQAVDQFRQHFQARIASSTPDNPLTPILKWGGILLTAVGVAGGLLLAANGFVGNVLLCIRRSGVGAAGAGGITYPGSRAPQPEPSHAGC